MGDALRRGRPPHAPGRRLGPPQVAERGLPIEAGAYLLADRCGHGHARRGARRRLLRRAGCLAAGGLRRPAAVRPVRRARPGHDLVDAGPPGQPPGGLAGVRHHRDLSALLPGRAPGHHRHAAGRRAHGRDGLLRHGGPPGRTAAGAVAARPAAHRRAPRVRRLPGAVHPVAGGVLRLLLRHQPQAGPRAARVAARPSLVRRHGAAAGRLHRLVVPLAPGHARAGVDVLVLLPHRRERAGQGAARHRPGRRHLPLLSRADRTLAPARPPRDPARHPGHRDGRGPLAPGHVVQGRSRLGQGVLHLSHARSRGRGRPRRQGHLRLLLLDRRRRHVAVGRAPARRAGRHPGLAPGQRRGSRGPRRPGRHAPPGRHLGHRPARRCSPSPRPSSTTTSSRWYRPWPS